MTVTYGDDPSGVYESAVYSYDPAPTPGTCSATIQNTATLFGDDHTSLGDNSEYGKVCVGADLTAGITDSESLTRTFPWSVQKATTTPNVTVTNGAATATYDVTVTAGDQVDSQWLISGQITVANPNAWDVPLTGLTVSYSGDNDANKADSCVVAESLADPVPANGNRVFNYLCTFDTMPTYDGTVDAAITWDAASAFTPHGSVTPPASSDVNSADWAVTEIDHTVTVHDDRATGQDVVIGTLDWPTVYAMEGHQTVIHYTVNLTGLPAAGACNNKVNTVWVVGHDGVHLDADEDAANNQATVRVCTPAVSPPIVSPPVVKPPSTLPNTGGPDAALLVAGLVLLLGGGMLVAGDRRRKRRS
jgi:LPXTG-motif cell wall-anchored protein